MFSRELAEPCVRMFLIEFRTQLEIRRWVNFGKRFSVNAFSVRRKGKEKEGDERGD